jgi:DNA-binding NtrC family response regulator
VHGERYGKDSMKLSTHTLEKLANHDWPGNVRELQHAMEKAVIMSDSNVLKPADFAFNPTSRSLINNEMTLDEMESRMIRESLKRYNSNMSVIAGKLGITRQTLYNKMKKYNIN